MHFSISLLKGCLCYSKFYFHVLDWICQWMRMCESLSIQQCSINKLHYGSQACVLVWLSGHNKSKQHTFPLIVFKCCLCAGVGWAMFVVSLLIAIYYNMIIAWTIYYLFASFAKILPWSVCGDWSKEGEKIFSTYKSLIKTNRWDRWLSGLGVWLVIWGYPVQSLAETSCAAVITFGEVVQWPRWPSWH